MRLYNTLTKSIDEFAAVRGNEITMYTCGPTVYHFAHIGNLRSYIMEDVLEKYLTYAGYDVKRCMNITDVGHLTSDADSGEDKMLKGAKREHKSVMEIAAFYTRAFFDDCEALNIARPRFVAPATSLVNEFIGMVEKLVEKGYAYISGPNVYFDTSKVPEYYSLTGHEEEELRVGVRDDVQEDTNKRNKSDFVLWFTKSKFEDQALKWDSPWGEGYPGWHIECSAIAIHYLGEYLDIHCGGVDNIFPHHTNEIAQSEAYLGHPWCRHWFHVQHLNDHGAKMAKSEGNILTVSVLREKGYEPLVYRFFCLQSHYRKPLEFSYEVLDNVKNAYDKLLGRIRKLEKGGVLTGEEEEKVRAYRAKFLETVGDDLNTASGITLLYDMLKDESLGDSVKRAIAADFDKVLSLGLLAEEEEREVDEALSAFVEERLSARKQAKADRDFALADAIRDELSEKGIEIKDTREGTIWSVRS